MSAFDELEKPWRECLRLALQATAAGSLGISAVIITSSGDIVSAGRNQLWDNAASPNVVKGTLISHAEINAIAGLPIALRRDKSLTLYTTVEPCPMCMGAIAMSSIKELVVASGDPWSGSTRLLEEDRYMKGKNISVTWAEGFVEEIFFHLHLLSHRMRSAKAHPFFTTVAERYPALWTRMLALETQATPIQALKNGDAAAFLKALGAAANPA